MDKDKLAHIMKVLNHLIDGLDELKKMPESAASERPAEDDLLRTVETENGKKFARMEVKRGTAAIEALRVINGERQNTYGNPEDSFNAIAGLWTMYSDRFFTPVDVAIMMALLKIARMKNYGTKHRDSFVDAIGYLALAADMVANDHADNASSDAVDDD